jgi:ABC-2 type transport system permease protein
MSAAQLVINQVRYEQKQYWRNPASAFFSLYFPIILLVIFSSLNKNDTNINYVHVRFTQYYIPAIIVFGVIGATFTNLAISLSIRRDLGILKRLRGTPLPTWGLMAGIIGSAIIFAALLTAVTIVVGVVFYDVSFPGRWLGLVLDIVVGVACFSALGLAVSTFIPNADAAPAITNGVLLPLIFISGTFFPIDPNSFISHLADVFPVRHFILTVFSAFDPNASSAGFVGRDLLVMAAWGVGGVLVGLRRFRWESRRT